MPNITELAEILKQEKEHFGTWDRVAEHHHVTKPCVWRIVNDGYEPRDFAIRKRLGLPLTATVTPIEMDIPFGTQALYARLCTCGQWFIPNAPRRTRCFLCSPYQRSKKG